VTTSQNQPFAATMPGPDALLPTEPKEIDRADRLEPQSVTISSLSTEEGIGPLGRAAQGVWILDQVLQTIRMEQTKCKLARLTELNDTLQSFTMTLMRQLYGGHELLCGSIAVVIRSVIAKTAQNARLSTWVLILNRTLFLLNEKIAAEQLEPTLDMNSWWQERIEQSQAALTTATKMMVDIVKSDSLASPPCAWPPSRLHRLRAALRHLKQQPYLRKESWYDDAEGRLREALDEVCWYWSVDRSKL
jgi:hypothetical protein